MANDVSIITAEQVKTILESEEGHFSELKSIDIKPSKLTKTISAFANTDSGEIIIGIDEDQNTKVRKWRGFSNVEAANAHLQVFEKMFPLGQDFQYEFLKANNHPGILLKINIYKTASIKKSSDGTVYIRRGASSIPVNDHESLKQLEYTKGISSFETELVNCEIHEVCNSIVVINFMLEVIPTVEPESWLRKNRLLLNDRPTVAAVLLFADEPQSILPKRSGIKIYRYKTSDSEGHRETLDFTPVTVEGAIYDQIFQAVDKTTEIIESIKKLGEKNLEQVSYPHETLHEIITNAVLHRDYNITDDIHVRIFDNRVEVENPGRLPAHITPENILNERFARNPVLVRLINKFKNPPNKDIGEGLNTAFEAMKKLRLKPPIIIQKDNSVLILIKHERLASPEEVIMQYLSKNPEINNTIARSVCHIESENAMKRVFERLMKRSLIERIPGRRGRAIAYRKCVKDVEDA